ncbi:MAG: hypothetical protein A2W90_16545 [Bacteroidetes bacterium GWF2_42_66]|nr:MAG: hypothetical protein A2W92_04070 [Bacteroidetes bacterium GWA2_42_15]OFX96303.1 MAG: hypothetical protein A2W89_05475 [Bacteroidetes bacterium GWE2_42_39]OFY46342.1 MAG: hypothetical protein A2W90_16545 [Bacteroidetes bacterium GWF2_42_66]HAZ03464.1 hypothetical protein [Marinilabiliales bacterium]HBL78272.1 hypothetical protein [Prolixibacteraceae bacterium]
MKTHNILIAHPSNEQEMNTIKAFFEALKIKFEVAKDTPYNPEFVAKIERGREEYRKGKGTSISINELNNLCK